MKKTRTTPTPRSRAWALACRLLPVCPGETEKHFWHDGAREIVFGLLLHVQTARPRLTNNKPLAQAAAALLARDYDQIAAAAGANPEAAVFFRSLRPGSLIAQTFMGEVAVALNPRRLARLEAGA